MADIFLSYNEKDRDVVRRLADTLKLVGWSVWWDRRIPAGGTWRALLERELASMRCMVVVWSSNSIRSEWVCEEATEGREAHRLVPVCIERVKPPAGFREIQAADLVGWDGSTSFVGMRTLIEDIQQLIGAPSVAPSSASHELAEPTKASPVEPAPATPTPRRRTAFVVAAVLLLVVALGWSVQASRSGRGDDVARAAPGSGTRPADAMRPVGGPLPNAVDPTPGEADRPILRAAPRTVETAAARAMAEHVDRPAGPAARCADLLQRASLGESLSAEASAFMKKACAK